MRSFEASNALYERALKTVPLATQTFSKSAMMQVRGAAPLFLERGCGARVWDVDGNEYIDLVGGLLPVVLGYCDEDVDRAVKEQLRRGVSFSLATELEVELSEVLVDHIPCADMVRFGKNGSDATSAAIRLARAYTGRARVACCGYHGWHDWYIGTTTRDLGVPPEIKGLSAVFAYNDPDSLEILLKRHPDEYAAVILEPAGLVAPRDGFLERLRELSDRYGVLLVFDEIVSGFRISAGGAQKHFGVTPDLACFGKAMGNGMPISALVGRREVMRKVEDIFFSGTFGGETLSLAASLETIKKIDNLGVCAAIWASGKALKSEIENLLERHELNAHFSIEGPDWWPVFSTQTTTNVRPSLLSSLLRQELCEEGILMLATLNLSFSHCTESELGELVARVDKALRTVARHVRSNDPVTCLRGEEIRPVFSPRRQGQ